MERYKTYSKQIIDQSTGKRRLSTAYYPTIPYRDSDIYVYSVSSDRLDLLAYKYYEDQTLWWVIARANNLGKGSFNIPPGRRIRIPYPLDPYSTSLYLTNTES